MSERSSSVAPRPIGEAVSRLALVLVAAYGLLAAGAGYWMVGRGPELALAPDNPAVVAATRNAIRGRILDRDGQVLATSKRDANGEPYRVYEDPSVAPVVGYASRRYGSALLERTWNADLLGLPGRDALSDLLAKFGTGEADPHELTLSLSLPLQERAVRLLGPDRGAVVMLDPRTGSVLVLASTPTFDASAIANPGTSERAFEALRDDPSDPLVPRATQGRYVPGSVFKIVTAAAALESGAITPSTTFSAQPPAERSGLLIGGFRVRDGHHPQTGERALAFAEAIEVSCNLYFALAGRAAGPASLTATAAAFGFGAPIPFDLPGEPSQLTNGGGPLPGGFADEVELVNAAYGQGEVLVTPLQMALVAAAVANDGLLMEPRLVTSTSSRQLGTRQIDPRTWRRAMSPTTAATIRDAMVRAVNGDLGRLFTSGAALPDVVVAGKSGTAQLGGRGEPHSWFIGFAPAERPVVAIAVLVERGGRGGERAAPLAGEMLRRYFATVGS